MQQHADSYVPLALRQIAAHILYSGGCSRELLPASVGAAVPMATRAVGSTQGAGSADASCCCTGDTATALLIGLNKFGLSRSEYVGGSGLDFRPACRRSRARVRVPLSVCLSSASDERAGDGQGSTPGGFVQFWPTPTMRTIAITVCR